MPNKHFPFQQVPEFGGKFNFPPKILIYKKIFGKQICWVLFVDDKSILLIPVCSRNGRGSNLFSKLLVWEPGCQMWKIDFLAPQKIPGAEPNRLWAGLISLASKKKALPLTCLVVSPGAIRCPFFLCDLLQECLIMIEDELGCRLQRETFQAS